MFSKALILASTSRYRRALLGRLGIAFDCVSPQVDETRHPGEPAADMAARLARLKAEVVFLTAVHVIDGPAGRADSHVDRTTVRFRDLAADEIDRYIERDKPLDCAGGFKAESLGIALFERIDSADPTGLTGLPLAWLCGALRRAGLRVP